MATKTTNYNLVKPDATDFYDINVQNQNMEIIDKELKTLENKNTFVGDVNVGNGFGNITADTNGILIQQLEEVGNSNNRRGILVHSKDNADDIRYALTYYDVENGEYIPYILFGEHNKDIVLEKIGGASSGLVKGSLTVTSNEGINTAIDSFVNQTNVNKQEVFILEVTQSGLAIPSNLYFVTVCKYTANYVGVTAVGVMSSAGHIIQRHKINGTWQAWKYVINESNVTTYAAPSGFGLGETNVNTSIIDANLITRSGFYGCNLNMPDSGWWYGMHIQYAPNYAWQKFAKSNDTVTVERKCYNGVWTEWKSLPTGAVVPASVE